MKTIRNIASILFVALGALGFISCTSHQEKVSDETNTLTLDETKVKEEIFSDEFCDFTFIPLETNEKCLISQIQKLAVTDNGFYVFSEEPVPAVYSFNLDGSYNCNIGSLGHAKNEYVNIINMDADPSGEKIAIIETHDKVKIFDKTGKLQNDQKILDEDYGICEMLMTPKGYYLGLNERIGNHMMAYYDENFQKQDDGISVKPIGGAGMICPRFYHSNQYDNGKICLLDWVSSTFYLTSEDSIDEVKCFPIMGENMLTEDKIPENGMLRDQNLGYVSSYVFTGNMIRGRIMSSTKFLNFRLNVDTSELELVKIHGGSYDNLYYHGGYFYRIYPVDNILHMIDPKNEGMYSDKEHNPGMFYKRELLKDAIEPIKGTIKESDNPYLLRMRLKKN